MALSLGKVLFALETAQKVCLKEFEYAWKEMD
jgi:hypothetical protein